MSKEFIIKNKSVIKQILKAATIFSFCFVLIKFHMFPLQMFRIDYSNWSEQELLSYYIIYHLCITFIIAFIYRKAIIKRRKEIGVIFFYLFANAFSEIPLQIFGINYSNWNNFYIYLYNILYQISIIAIIIWIYKEIFINNLKDFYKNFKSYIHNYIKFWFIALGLMILSNLLIQPFTSSDVAQNEETIRSFIKAAPIYMFIASVIIAPISEELIFRLVIRKMINTKFLFITVSGLVFGLMHVASSATVWSDWLYLIPYSIPGFVFAYTLVKSNNIFVPISLHLIHNGILVTLQILLLTII